MIKFKDVIMQVSKDNNVDIGVGKDMAIKIAKNMLAGEKANYECTTSPSRLAEWIKFVDVSVKNDTLSDKSNAFSHKYAEDFRNGKVWHD